MLYKQKQEEAMKQQGEKVQEILSNAPLSNPNIGPIKPVVQTSVKRLNKTGVKLPGKFFFWNFLWKFFNDYFASFIFSQFPIELTNNNINTNNADNTNRFKTRATYAFTRRFVRIVSSSTSGALGRAIIAIAKWPISTTTTYIPTGNGKYRATNTTIRYWCFLSIFVGFIFYFQDLHLLHQAAMVLHQ